MNGLFELLGIQAWKPVLTALILPPVPFLVLLLVGARLILPRRGLGWFLIVLSVVVGRSASSSVNTCTTPPAALP